MMSKKLCLAIVGLCFPAMSFAQPVVGAVANASPVKFDLGIKLGANFSRLQGSIWDDTYRTGFVGGAFGGVHFKKFGVSAELLYSRVKFTYKPSTLSGSLFTNPADSAKANTYAVTSLSIPVLLGVKLVGPLWFQVGPQYNGIINIGDENGFLKDVNTVFKSGDISGVLGLWLNVSKLNVGARYIIGFSDMNNTSFGDSWKNRSIQLHIGYSFL